MKNAFTILLLVFFLLDGFTPSFAEEGKEDTEIQQAIKIINLGETTVARIPTFLLAFNVYLSDRDISFSIDEPIENVLVTIKDENGTVIDEKTYNVSESVIYSFNVNHLATGNYIIRFTVPRHYGYLYQGSFTIAD